MTFAEKLETIMNITMTTNSALSMQISVDASLISRFRHGSRTPPKDAKYLLSIASYFSQRISTDYKKAALCEILNISIKDFPKEQEKITEFIYQWLSGENVKSQNAAQAFIDSLTNFQFKKPPQISDADISKVIDACISGHTVFYDIQGKQEAALSFLSLVLKSKKPQTLLLFSDESFAWLAEYPEFIAKWKLLMSQVVMRGNKIQIIHTVNRSMDEMFAAVKEWVPIYMSGAIQPYYYPKTRDGVFKRTLFIAPDTAAIASSSVATQKEKIANFLYTDKAAIAALTEEFNSYLAMCRPLMKIYTQQNNEMYLKTLSEFENEQADIILKSEYMSGITMPYELLESLLSQVNSSNNNRMLNYLENRIDIFEKSLNYISFTEIITLPEADTIKSGRLKVLFSDMFFDSEIFYTVDEFINHIRNILRLLKSYENYNVYISAEKDSLGCIIYAKESVGVLIAKTAFPSVIFAINESNLTAAFWDYLSMMSGKIGNANKKDTIAALEAFIEKLM